jgi:hypothetical protein
MKNQLKATMIITWMVIMSTLIQAQPVTFQTFYQELSPYGAWMNYHDYGQVWMPNAGPDFRPYATNGYWAVTEYGNTWVSDYSWGWAPFHYGRWIFDDFYGWLWIPGSEWAPAWVAWRSGGGYYGWAPLGPRVSINIAVNIPNHHWYFVPQQHLCGPGVSRYYVRPTHIVNIYHHTTIINHMHDDHHYRYFTGPTRHEIEARRGGRSVEVYSMGRSERPGATVVHHRSINMYRPSFDSDRNERSRMDDKRDVQPRTDRQNDDRRDNGRNTTYYSNENVNRNRPSNEKINRNQPARIETSRTEPVERSNRTNEFSHRAQNQTVERTHEPAQRQQFQRQEQSRQFTNQNLQRQSQRNNDHRQGAERSGGRSRR